MSTEPARVTVARNIRRLRLAAGWTQAEACNRLAEHGVTWGRKAWSVMERSVDGGRVRHFSADEIAALAATFKVTPDALFGTPDAYLPAVDQYGRDLWLSERGSVQPTEQMGDGSGTRWVRLYRPATSDGVTA